MTLPTFTGTGYLAGESPDGLTTVVGVPVAATVQVLWRDPDTDEEHLVASTTSTSAGTWQITDLNHELQYVVRGIKSGWNDVSVVGATPTRMDVITATGTLTTNEAGNGVAGSLLIEGGLPPYTVSVIDPLPYGLAPVIDYRTLTIGGTSGDEGEWPATLRITSANSVEVYIQVVCAIVVGDAFSGQVAYAVNGDAYNAVLSAKTYLSAPIVWSVVSGALPSGLSLVGNDGSASISGVPDDNVGSYSFVVRMESHIGYKFDKQITLDLYDEPPPVFVWDVSRSNADFDITEDGKLATLKVSKWQKIAFVGMPKSSGKVYFAVDIVNAVSSSTNLSIGVANGDVANSQINIDVSGAISYRNNGQVFNGTSYGGSYSYYNNGAVIGVAVDFGAGRVWFTKNGVSISGKPSTGAGGFSFPFSGRSMSPCFFAETSEVAVRLREATIAECPSGFMPWHLS